MTHALPDPADVAGRRLSRIAGCRLVECGPNHARSGMPSSFVIEGLGPSLHRMTMEWPLDLETCRDRAGMLRAVEHVVRVQRRRRDEVERLGLGVGSGFATRSEILHIQVDRVMHSMLVADARSAGAGAGGHMDAYRRTIDSILTASGQGLSDGITVSSSSGAITELEGRPLLLMPRNVGIGSFDGARLSMPYDPPEITVSLMHGRMVSDVVDLPSHLEALSTRMVRSASKRSGWLTIAVDADPVTIGETVADTSAGGA